MLSPGQITKPNDAIESQKTHPSIPQNQHNNVLPVQPDSVKDSQQTHPSIPQDENIDTMEASKEEGVNLYRVNDTPSGKQPSPYYSSPQPNSFLSPDTLS